MPPEQSPFLAILDVEVGGQGVSGRVEYAKPVAWHEYVRVRWGAGTPPSGYSPMVDGVVFVADCDPESRAKISSSNVTFCHLTFKST